MIEIASQERRRVSWMRVVLFLVMLATVVLVSFSAYYYARSEEQEEFETSFDDMAHKLASAFRTNAKRRVGAIQSLATTITSSAIAENQTWPNVTLADFEIRANYILDLAEVMSIMFWPFVTGDTRKGWEAYSVEHQGWYKEAMEVQGNIAAGQPDEEESIDIVESTWGSSPNGTIPEEINRLTGNGLEIDTEDGPYAPLWQVCPALPTPNVYNYNGLSHPSRQKQIKAIIKEKNVLVSGAWDYSDVNNPGTVGKKAALNLFLNRREDFRGSYQDGKF